MYKLVYSTRKKVKRQKQKDSVSQLRKKIVGNDVWAAIVSDVRMLKHGVIKQY